MMCKTTGGDGHFKNVKYTPEQAQGYTIKVRVDVHDSSMLFGDDYRVYWYNLDTGEVIGKTSVAVGAGETKTVEFISVMPSHPLRCNISLVVLPLAELIEKCNDYKEFTISLSDEPVDPEPKFDWWLWLEEYWWIIAIAAIVIVAVIVIVLWKRR